MDEELLIIGWPWAANLVFNKECKEQGTYLTVKHENLDLLLSIGLLCR